jgi:hypothetical protein
MEITPVNKTMPIDGTKESLKEHNRKLSKRKIKERQACDADTSEQEEQVAVHIDTRI